jgi:hypothetical protein
VTSTPTPLRGPHRTPPDLPGTTRVEEWAALNLLALANTPGEITRKGAGNDRDSVIDLAWYNDAAVHSSSFSDLK